MLTDLLGAEDSQFLEGGLERMLLDDEKYLVQVENGAVPEGYMDPILRHNPHIYLDFVMHLRQIGMLQWTLRPGAH
eukprot:1544115-Amphidinium_carterae.1